MFEIIQPKTYYGHRSAGDGQETAKSVNEYTDEFTSLDNMRYIGDGQATAPTYTVEEERSNSTLFQLELLRAQLNQMLLAQSESLNGPTIRNTTHQVATMSPFSPSASFPRSSIYSSTSHLLGAPWPSAAPAFGATSPHPSILEYSTAPSFIPNYRARFAPPLYTNASPFPGALLNANNSQLHPTSFQHYGAQTYLNASQFVGAPLYPSTFQYPAAHLHTTLSQNAYAPLYPAASHNMSTAVYSTAPTFPGASLHSSAPKPLGGHFYPTMSPRHKTSSHTNTCQLTNLRLYPTSTLSSSDSGGFLVQNLTRFDGDGAELKFMKQEEEHTSDPLTQDHVKPEANRKLQKLFEFLHVWSLWCVLYCIALVRNVHSMAKAAALNEKTDATFMVRAEQLTVNAPIKSRKRAFNALKLRATHCALGRITADGTLGVPSKTRKITPGVFRGSRPVKHVDLKKKRKINGIAGIDRKKKKVPTATLR